MKHTQCVQCGSMTPTGRSFSWGDRTFCEPCLRPMLEQIPESERSATQITQNVDPTICAMCGHDAGQVALERVVGVPACEPCGSRIRRRPFPFWVKAACALVAVLVMVSFVRNKKFLDAYKEIQHAGKALQSGDVRQASQLMSDAAQKIPENREIAASAALFQGIAHLQDDEAKEALDCFRNARQNGGTGAGLEEWILRAEASVAFEEKDFDQFVAKMEALRQNNRNDVILVMGCASAYACKYAQTGDESDKARALEELRQSAMLRGADAPEAKEYEQRIRHRIATREIIDRNEFIRRYPSGWTGEGGDK